MSVEKNYFNWNVSFPAITLCPLYKIDEELQAAFFNEFPRKESALDVAQDLVSYLEAITFASLESIHMLQIPDSKILPLINSSNYAKIAADIFRRFRNSSVGSNTDRQISIGIEPVMTEMGMCHVINSNVAVFDNPENWARNDLNMTYPNNQVDLSFHDSDFFIEVMDYAESYKIYTQSSNDILLTGAPSVPFDDEGHLSFGVHISSTRASPELRSMALHRRKCRFVDEPDSTRYPVYSYNRCLMQCRINAIKTICGCVPHFYRPIEGEKVCNLLELKCIIEYKKEVITLSFGNTTDGTLPRHSRDCNCLGDCEQDHFQRDTAMFLPQEDTSKLKVYVAAFPKKRIMREILFNIHDIVLRSGGVVNLCIGASFISAMELLMTFIRIPLYRIARAFSNFFRTSNKK